MYKRQLFGCAVEFGGSYPGWTPNPKSEILDVLTSIYEKQNGDKPKVVACHAGLECGILGTNYPGTVSYTHLDVYKRQTRNRL